MHEQNVEMLIVYFLHENGNPPLEGNYSFSFYFTVLKPTNKINNNYIYYVKEKPP